MKLYELQDQLVQIDNVLEQNTDPESAEILESAREQILQAIDGKCENILDFIDDCKTKVAQLKEQEERLAKKRKTLENKVEYLRNMVLWYMKTNDKTKESFGTWDVTVSKTAGKVVLDIAEDDIPVWLKKQSWTVDKTAIKESMVNDKAFVAGIDGMPVQVAHIEYGESLRIK